MVNKSEDGCQQVQDEFVATRGHLSYVCDKPMTEKQIDQIFKNEAKKICNGCTFNGTKQSAMTNGATNIVIEHACNLEAQMF